MDTTSFPRLGVDRDALHTERLEELCALGIAIATQCRRSLDLISRDLDPRLYDQAGFLDAVRALATSGRHARIRILIRETDAAVRTDHRLIELARRLSSFIEIRRMADEDAEFNEAFLIADQTGYLRRPIADRNEAEGSFHAPLRCRELLRTFEGLWSRGRPDANLRRLHV